MITGLAHVCFYVKDLDKTLDFYTNILGMKLSYDIRNAKNEVYGFMFHLNGPSCIEIFRGDYGDSTKSSYKHLALESNDIHTDVATLRSKMIDVTEVSRAKENSLNAFLKDPDGNIIELMQYTHESKQITHLKGKP